MGYNILVTGCGGDIGQSVGKILKSNAIAQKVIGSDLNDQHAGKFIFDRCYNIAGCQSKQYLLDLERIIKEESIDLIIPVSEPELRFLSNSNIISLVDRPIVMANIFSRIIGFDKLATADFLRDQNLPYPNSSVVGDLKNPVFPLILKSRDGSGSKSLFLINNGNDFDYYSKKFPDFIAQEMIGTAEAEYTCGVFRSKDGESRTITYKRKLVGGFSGYGSVESDPEITDLLLTMAEKLNLRGSINVQLRTSPKGPCVFEINPRFSSTVMFRHLMGFEDVIWSIQDALSLSLAEYLPNNNYKKFYKGYQEYVD